MSGDGGDELFFGYERFWSVAKNIKYQRLPWVLKAIAYKADKLLTKNKNINGVVLAADQASAHRSLHSRFSSDWIERIFPDLKGVSTPHTYNSYVYKDTGDINKLIQLMRKAEFYGMMQKTLRKVDLASMGVSLEVRVPFLKKSFIEAALKLDPMLSYGPNQKKRLLKAHLSNLYPQAPIDNVKRGFTVPLGRWLGAEGFRRRIAETLVGDEFLGRFGGNVSAVEELIAIHGPHTDRKWPIFSLLALQRQSRSAVPSSPMVREQDFQISSM